MPSRLLTLLILIFWLATTIWFVVRDMLPEWQKGDAPPFSIELADEAIRQVVPIRWKIVRDGEPIGTLRTQLRFVEADDVYEYAAECSDLPLFDAALPLVGRIGITARKYTDVLRVTREGELRGIETQIVLAVRSGTGPPLVARAELSAEVRRGRLQRRLRVTATGLGEFAPELEPAELIRGSVLNPLHPINRISGLKPGQHWRQPLVAPHEEIIRAALAKLPGAETVAAAIRSDKPRWLDAAVQPATETIDWDRGEVDCLVIEYHADWHGEEFTARTWVRQSDGIVLRQEAIFQGQTLVLERESG